MTEEAQIKVWDIAVRAFHWSLVFLFFIAYVSGEEESLLHVYAGYGVLALVAFRLVWGFVGTEHARFANFVSGPVAIRRYIGSLKTPKPLHYLGHNPLAGWMIVTLLVCLLVVCWTGLKAYAEQGYGPLAIEATWGMSVALADDHEPERRGKLEKNHDQKEGDEFWKEVHEAISELTLFLVFLHVLGGLVSSFLHRENLIKAMITGYKTRRTP